MRQSTLRQVLTNTESATLQYGLRQKAIALGWSAERIVNTDQGQSGASAADREGFQRLVAEVGMGRAGTVLGLEVCRLARNHAAGHRPLDIRAMSGTLICDEDGLYDPTDFNDRLLLGLKGTASEPNCTSSGLAHRRAAVEGAAAPNWAWACQVGLIHTLLHPPSAVARLPVSIATECKGLSDRSTPANEMTGLRIMGHLTS